MPVLINKRDAGHLFAPDTWGHFACVNCGMEDTKFLKAVVLREEQFMVPTEYRCPDAPRKD